MGLIDAITAVAEPRRLDDCDEWCVGLPLSSVRLLESEELALLKEQVNTQFSRQQAVSVSCAFFFAALYIASILFPSPLTFWLTASAASLMGVFVIWLFCDPESWLRRYKSLQYDLASGIVHSFQNGECNATMEVLPCSEIVYRSNNLSPKKWRRAPIVSVAKTPPIASIAVDWLQPVGGAIGRFLSGKRALSMAEREEIRRWAGQVLDDRRRHAVNYVCWAVFLGWLCRWGNQDLFYAAVAFTGYGGSRIYSEIQSVLALRRDAEDGVVVINRRAKVIDGEVVPFGTASEFLPKAKLKWTEDGTPAEWRKLP